MFRRRPLIVAISWGLLFVAGGLLITQVPLGTVALFLFYFLPVFVAALRAKAHPGGVVVVNLLLGWTVIGWIVALAMSASGGTTKDVVPVRHVDTHAPIRSASVAPALQPINSNSNARWGWGIAGALILAILYLAQVISQSPAASTAPRAAAAATIAGAAATVAPAPTAPHIGSVVRGGNWQYEVLKVDGAKTLRTGPYDFEVLTPKGTWVVVAFNLTNVGDRNFTLNDWDVELRDSKGITYDPSYSSSSYSHYLNRAALGEQMPPGVTVMITLLFDVAPGTTGMKLHPVQGGPDIRLE